MTLSWRDHYVWLWTHFTRCPTLFDQCLRSWMLPRCYFDLSRAEALRIPRGTLHGSCLHVCKWNWQHKINCPLKGMDCNGLLNFQYDVIRVQSAFLPVSFTTWASLYCWFPTDCTSGLLQQFLPPNSDLLSDANKSQFQTTSPYRQPHVQICSVVTGTHQCFWSCDWNPLVTWWMYISLYPKMEEFEYLLSLMVSGDFRLLWKYCLQLVLGNFPCKNAIHINFKGTCYMQRWATSKPFSSLVGYPNFKWTGLRLQSCMMEIPSEVHCILCLRTTCVHDPS